MQNLIELVARTEEDKQLVVLFARTRDCMQTQGKANHSCTDTQRHAKHTHTHWVWNVPRMKVKSKFAQCVHLGCDRYVCMKLCANTRAHTHTHTQGLTSNANVIVSKCVTTWVLLGPPTWLTRARGPNVKQSNTCCNNEGCSLVTGLHVHGDQPLVATTPSGSHMAACKHMLSRACTS